MKKWEHRTAGIPDDLFIRGDVPMTKEEVRAVIIAKLRLNRDHIVYDIGAGTGSISIEAALQAEEGSIYAIEMNKEAISLIASNIEEFKLNNIEIIAGQATEVIDILPSPDRVIIGGSGGCLKEIIHMIDTKIKKDGRIVISAVTLNTLNIAISQLEGLNYKLDICSIAVTRTRKVADYHMFKALNPIFIITASKEKGGL